MKPKLSITDKMSEQTKFEKALFTFRDDYDVRLHVSRQTKGKSPDAFVIGVYLDDADVNPDNDVVFWVFDQRNIPVSRLLMLGRKAFGELHANKAITCIVQYRDKENVVKSIMPNGTMLIGDLFNKYKSSLELLHVIFTLENTFG